MTYNVKVINSRVAGLGYESDDESEGGDAADKRRSRTRDDSDSDSDDEQAVRERINRKRYEFERKMREMEENESGTLQFTPASRCLTCRVYTTADGQSDVIEAACVVCRER